MYERLTENGWVVVQAEKKRGCGFRKIGGLYMVCPPVTVACDRVVALRHCPVCGAVIKQSRGWTWVDTPYDLFGGTHQEENRRSGRPPLSCTCDSGCPICWPPREKAGLLWVGKRYYTVQSFLREARELGVSKRVRGVPRGFKPGETVVYLAHPEAIPPGHPALGGHGGDEEHPVPGIFCAFRPRLEQIFPNRPGIKESEEVKRAAKRGITPVLVPDEEKHR